MELDLSAPGYAKTVTLNDGMATFANLSDDLAETIGAEIHQRHAEPIDLEQHRGERRPSPSEVGDLDGAVRVGNGWAGVWNAAGDPGKKTCMGTWRKNDNSTLVTVGLNSGIGRCKEES